MDKGVFVSSVGIFARSFCLCLSLTSPGCGHSLCFPWWQLIQVPAVEHKVTVVLSSISLLSILPSSSCPRTCPVFSLTVGGVTIDKDDPSKVEALVGQTVVLPCRVSPPPSSTVSVEWRRDGVPLSTNRSGGTVTLSSIMHMTAGAGGWECPAQEPIREHVSAKGLHHACLPLMLFLKFLQASPAAKRLPAGRPPHQARLWLVLVCGHAGAGERPPLHLPLCHRY